MKLTKEELQKIRETIEFVLNEYKEIDGQSENLQLSDADIDKYVLEENYEGPFFHFPGEFERIRLDSKYFLQIADEIPTIQIIENSIVKTEYYRYYLVDNFDLFEDITKLNKYNLELNIGGADIDLVSENFIVGLAALKAKMFSEEYAFGPLSSNMAIEIRYNSKEAVLEPQEERELINAYIFEIADSTDIILSNSEFRNYGNFEDEDEQNFEENDNADDQLLSLRDIEAYNEGMRLFISAIQIKESELKFLNFYKILEHFAPIAVNIEANELMRKKLDAPRHLFEYGDFIRSIFDLSKSMREKFNDEDLIKATFSSCFDFVGLFERLPDSIKSKIKKQIGKTRLDYSTDKQSIAIAGNMVGKIIYATRNKVVHAKSNYETSGNECENSDLEELNGFMREACSQTIRWYNRLIV